MLVGVILDVSGSMRQSLGASRDRISAVWESLHGTLREASAERTAELRLFACLCGVQVGNGVADLMSLMNVPNLDPHEVAKQTGLETWYLAARTSFSQDQLRRIAAALARRPEAAAELRALLPQKADLPRDSDGCLWFLKFLFGAGKAVNHARKGIDQATKFAKHLAEEELLSQEEPPRYLAELAKMFEHFNPFDSEGLDKFLFGKTPLMQALKRMRERFEMYRQRGEMMRLIVISDGQATDGDPAPAAEQMRRSGVQIVSCLIAEHDVVAPRVFPTSSAANNGLAAMARIASSVREAPDLADAFARLGWTCGDDARLVIQANHTKLLDELFRGVLIER